jgi:hypothetical protein
MQGKNVLRKEPMGKEVEETDMFSVNDSFTSKFYKVKVGTISAQKDSEPEKLETRQKVEEDRKPQVWETTEGCLCPWFHLFVTKSACSLLCQPGSRRSTGAYCSAGRMDMPATF